MLVLMAGIKVDGDFLKVPIEQHRALFDINVVPSLILARLMTDRFLNRTKRSAIVYSSSTDA